MSNRRAFLQRANLEVERARRYSRPLSLIAFDLDHFKAINDTCGHTVGDVALQAVTRTCEAMLRVHDSIGRLGGEEFAIALPELTLPEARQVAERLCVAIAATQLRADGTVRLSASFGVAELAECDLTMHELLTRADHALYLAKAGGRNRVEAARPTLAEPAGDGGVRPALADSSVLVVPSGIRGQHLFEVFQQNPPHLAGVHQSVAALLVESACANRTSIGIEADSPQPSALRETLRQLHGMNVRCHVLGGSGIRPYRRGIRPDRRAREPAFVIETDLAIGQTQRADRDRVRLHNV